MSAPKILITVVVATSMSILTCANPVDPSIPNKAQQDPTASKTNLNEVLNKTVCPIRVEYDVEEGRVPRTIKMMKCDTQPSHCSRSDMPSVDCCNHDNHHEYTSCKEISDTVLVFYETTGSNNTTVVSVGCTCMVHQKTKPKEATGSS